MLKAHFDVIQCFSMLGRNFAEMKEPQLTASETFRVFSEMHRSMEKDGLKMLKSVKPVLSDLGTYLTKAIPDTKMTIRRYADAKFTYLSYCLKVKELDDEEHTFTALQDPLYRVETGNYEYRLILRCRQEARAKFASLRNDVLEKLELLESKHAQDLANHLRKLINGLANYSRDIFEKVKLHPNLFPIEVDLKPSAFQYKSTEPTKFEEEVDEIPIEMGQEAFIDRDGPKTGKREPQIKKSELLIPGFDDINLDEPSETDKLLVELGIADVDLTPKPNTIGSDRGDENSLQNCIDWLAFNVNENAGSELLEIESIKKSAPPAEMKNEQINLLD